MRSVPSPGSKSPIAMANFVAGSPSSVLSVHTDASVSLIDIDACVNIGHLRLDVPPSATVQTACAAMLPAKSAAAAVVATTAPAAAGHTVTVCTVLPGAEGPIAGPSVSLATSAAPLSVVPLTGPPVTHVEDGLPVPVALIFRRQLVLLPAGSGSAGGPAPLVFATAGGLGAAAAALHTKPYGIAFSLSTGSIRTGALPGPGAEDDGSCPRGLPLVPSDTDEDYLLPKLDACLAAGAPLLSQSGTSAPFASLNWHASEPGFVCVSACATQLLSGGGEGCLCVWDLTDQAATKPRTLPRLGGPLVGAAVPPPADDAGRRALIARARAGSGGDSARARGALRLATAGAASVAVTIDTNRVVVVSTATGKLEREVRSLPYAASRSYGAPAPAAPGSAFVDPRTSSLVVPGVPGTIDFHSIKFDTHTGTGSVLQRESASSAPGERRPKRAAVVSLGASADGSVLAVLDGAEWSVAEDFRAAGAARAGSSSPAGGVRRTSQALRAQSTYLRIYERGTAAAAVATAADRGSAALKLPRAGPSATYNLVTEASGAAGTPPAGAGPCARRVAVSPDGSRVAVPVVDGAGPAVVVWERQAGTAERVARTSAAFVATDADVRASAVESREGGHRARATAAAAAAGAWTAVRSLRMRGLACSGVCFTHDGSAIVTSFQAAGSVAVWAAATGALLGVVPGRDFVTDVAAAGPGFVLSAGRAEKSIVFTLISLSDLAPVASERVEDASYACIGGGLAAAAAAVTSGGRLKQAFCAKNGQLTALSADVDDVYVNDALAIGSKPAFVMTSKARGRSLWAPEGVDCDNEEHETDDEKSGTTSAAAFLGRAAAAARPTEARGSAASAGFRGEFSLIREFDAPSASLDMNFVYSAFVSE